MILTDILDLLKFQPKPLEHYGKYALSITIPILLVMSLVYNIFRAPACGMSLFAIVLLGEKNTDNQIKEFNAKKNKQNCQYKKKTSVKEALKK